MSDPLTALMHAVQVMNFLKTLTLRTLREREEAEMEGYTSYSRSCSSDELEGEYSDTSGELLLTPENSKRVEDDQVNDMSTEEVEERFLSLLELHREEHSEVEEISQADCVLPQI